MDHTDELLLVLSTIDENNNVEIFEEFADIIFGRHAFSSEYYLNDVTDCGLYGKILREYEIPSDEYEITLTVLKLLLGCAEENSLLNDERYCNCLSYILRYVFVNYQHWTYRECTAMNLIGFTCLKIFNKILDKSIAENIRLKELRFTKASKICCSSFLYEEPGNILLRILSEGNDTLTLLNEKLIDSPDEFKYISETIRLVISLLIRLMDSKIILLFQRTSNYLPPLFSSFFLKNRLDNVGFLIKMASYLNCRLCNRIAQLTAIFLQRISEVFPSSLLFGFGESVTEFCEQFLNLYHSPPENPQFRARLTKFLTTCLEYQTALAEKLITPVQDKPYANYNKANIILQSILVDLKNDQIHPDLFVTSVRFLTCLWRCNYTDCMKFYKTAANFWQHVTAPLACAEENFHLTSCCQILQLLTWEIFRSQFSNNKLSSNNTDQDVSVVTVTILEVDRLKLIFGKMQDFLQQSQVNVEEKLRLVKQFLDFLEIHLYRSAISSYTEKNTFLIVELNLRLQLSLIDNMKFDSDGECSLFLAVGSLYNIFAQFCSKNYERSIAWVDVGRLTLKILDRLNDMDTMDNDDENANLPKLILQPASCLLIILSNYKNFDKKREFFDSMTFESCICELLNKLIARYPKQISTEFSERSLHAITSLVACLSLSIKYSPSSVWLHALKKCSISANLMQLLNTTTSKSPSPRLFNIICHLFSSLAVHQETAAVVRTSGFSDFICASLLSTPLVQSEVIFESITLFYNEMLLRQNHRFVDETAQFFTAWEEYIFQFINAFFADTSDIRFNGIYSMCILFGRFSHEKEIWFRKSTRLLNIIADFTSAIIIHFTNIITRPSYLVDSVRLKKRTKTVENQSLSNPEKLKKALEALLICIHVLITFSPSLQALCLYDNVDFEAYRCVCSPNFSTNVSSRINDNYQLTFGHLFLIIQYCVSALRKTDPKLSSPASRSFSGIINPLAFQQTDREILFTLLESSVYFCLTQGVFLYQQLDASESQRNVVKRELATELGLLLSKCGRPSSSPSSSFRKSPNGSSSSSICPSPAVTSGFFGFNQDFLNHMRDLVNTMVKS